ncbi:unnamed protein product [Darwinula stevensoni]|uniref:Peptidase M14 domain-containing protein n=1 Tax=Darwinula stevensoni TaxID=69355 RepID=A0A7R8X301_9CRUS|nr:unnamed protein product [Darwinula stevensoni]CAG0881815.1 unnamed protein product [Darwinula stevensoni]
MLLAYELAWCPRNRFGAKQNFYLIDPYLVYFIATLLCRRLIWQVIQGLTTLILPSSISKHVLEFLKLFVIGAIVGNLLWCTYHIFQNHPVMNFCYLFYPFAVYVILFWPCMNAFFDLIPSCEPREDRVKTSKAGLYHTCSSSPQTIRGEVEMLKGDFNLRMRHVLFNSLLNAYYVGFLPCCFAQTALHYDVTWATLHLAYIWVSCFIFHMIHCYPPRYCDTLHRAALHLGRWSKVEGRHAYLPYALHNVIRVHAPDEAVLSRILDDLDLISPVDVWRWRRESVDFMIAPAALHHLIAQLHDSHISYEILIPNVQRLLDSEKAAPKGSKMDWISYHRLADASPHPSIHEYMDTLAADYSHMVEVFSIGTSTMGHDLMVMKVSTGNATRSFWIDGGIHAREWISPATSTYIMREFVENYDVHKDVVDLYDWYFLPVVNPDGYEYSQTENRLWRKTRSDHDSPSGCIGVDSNRNFDFHWMESGASSDKCSEIYAGPEAESEPENRAIRDFLMQFVEDTGVSSFEVLLSLHSYGQLWLSPWGYADIKPEDYSDLEELGLVGVEAIFQVHGLEYTFGTSPDVLYLSSGGTKDWSKGVAGIKYSYTIELRDTGFHGFVLPPEEIIPTGEEILSAVKACALHLQGKGRTMAQPHV